MWIFRANRGDVVSLIGSSGSGKSTLLRCCNLLEDSQQGDVLFKGEPVTWKGKAMPPPADAQTGAAHPHKPVDGVPAVQPLGPHEHSAKRDGSAADGAGPRPQPKSKNPRAPIWTKSASATNAMSFPAQLSGGQQQRAAIARALCMEPEACCLTNPPARLILSWSKRLFA